MQVFVLTSLTVSEVYPSPVKIWFVMPIFLVDFIFYCWVSLVFIPTTIFDIFAFSGMDGKDWIVADYLFTY